ncbi:hypothetical protein [Methylocaldum sp.]|uniref:hypothetical protein n=1 Tax=Methylocaldum sp. TaxID=1969727 RepID=UPI002D300577|nr:hypothetical protein [Methylocaldum sp.]HYE35489.1 hypothetical protein [Methylocaldum sp.]
MSRKPTETELDEHVVTDAGNELAHVSREYTALTHEIDERFGDIIPYQRDRVIQETRFYLAQSAETLLEAGRRLVQLKEHEPHGDWLNTLDQIGIHPRAAQRLMAAAVKLANTTLVSRLKSPSKTKLIELATLDDDEIQELGEGGTVRGLKLDEIDRMSPTELRAALRKAKTDNQKQLADLKGDLDAKAKLIAAKNEKIDELSTKLDKRQYAEPEDHTSRYVLDLQNEALAIAVKIQTGLMARIVAVLDVHTPEQQEHARLLVAQALGQIVSMARMVGKDVDVLPAEDGVSLFREAAGDDDREIWAKINADLAEQNAQAGTVN